MSILPYRLTLTCILAAVIGTVITDDDCNSPGSFLNGVDCTFYWGFCGWRNRPDNDVNWARVYTDYEGWYLRANTTFIAPGRRIAISGPTLCATEDKVYALKFKYFLQTSGNCLLSVKLESSGKSVVVWNTTRTSVVGDENWVSRQALVSSPQDSFKIVFEASRLSRRPCGTYNAIELDSISLDYDSILTTTTPTPTTATTTIESSTSNITYQTSSFTYTEQTSATLDTMKDMDGSSSAGVAVAIGIAVVVVVVIIVLGIILYRKRRCLKSKHRDSEIYLNKRSTAVSNDMYTEICSSRPEKAVTGRDQIRGTFGDAEADRREISNHYSEPFDIDTRSTPPSLAPLVEDHGGENHYSYVLADGYNKLSFSNAHPQTEPSVGYDHLSDAGAEDPANESGPYSTPQDKPRSRDQSPSQQANRHEYENLSSSQRGGPTTKSGVYNQLDLKGEGHTTSDDVQAKAADTYDRLC